MKFKKVAGMLCLAMFASKTLSACTPEEVQDVSSMISEVTGLDEQNVNTVIGAVTEGAHKLDEQASSSANSALETVAGTIESLQEQGVPESAVPAEFKGNGQLSVHFIDVGQGDAVLLSYTEDGNTEYALIDAGDNSKGTTVQKYLMDEGVESLKYLILTHPDADHIGGADVIITKFDIDNIFMSAVEKDTATYRDVIKAMEYKSYTWTTPDVGQTFELGSAEMEVLAAPYTYADVNNDSIVVKVTYGESSFLFMGDAEFEEEEELLARFGKSDPTLDVDVLKAGHHGSYTASSNEFIGKVTPEWTVISCGLDNKYGHPHNTSLYNFADYESDLFRTDLQGSIVCTTDGVSYEWNRGATQNWKAGNEVTADDIEYDR